MLAAVKVVSFGTALVEPGRGTTVTTEIEVGLLPDGPTTVEFNWPYGAAGAPVPYDPPAGKLAEARD